MCNQQGGGTLVESTFQLFLSSRIGDGCCHISTGSKNARIEYMGINKDYIQYKHDILSKEYKCSDVKFRLKPTKFNPDGYLYELWTRNHVDITQIYNMRKTEVISNLDEFGFLIYYLDDGTYNKTSKTCTIYCNSFTTDEVCCLKNKICSLFSLSPNVVCIQKKLHKNTQYNIYVKRVGSSSIVTTHREFILNHQLLHGMAYKLGVVPSQTIESNKCNSLTGE